MDDKESGLDSMLTTVKKLLYDRFGSVMYGTFFVSWCIWNWETLYVTFILDQDLIFQKFDQLKIEYIFGLYGGFWTKLLFLFIGPVLSAILIVWILPYFDRCFLKQGYRNKKESDKIESDYRVAKSKLDRREIEEKIEKADIEQELIAKMNVEEKWDIEYEKLINDDLLNQALQELYDCLYSRSGQTVYYDSTGMLIYQMSSTVRGYLDLNNLVSYSGDNINMTEKGKYFLKKFTFSKKHS